MCGPVFDNFPINHEKVLAFNYAEKTSKIFYKMVKGILTLKDNEDNDNGPSDGESGR